jgi:hypothetical protein
MTHKSTQRHSLQVFNMHFAVLATLATLLAHHAPRKNPTKMARRSVNFHALVLFTSKQNKNGHIVVVEDDVIVVG